MSKWKNGGTTELIFGQHIVQPGQTMEVDDERDVEVETITGFARVGGAQVPVQVRRVGLDPSFGLGGAGVSPRAVDAETGKGDE